ncbi:hypothetical protein K1T71_007662 [Dendrolimus kikuchii]|uniref:Uncharacterized protein n=1 Tax=Dendrolimus kikuchii TaxID=765133 RepID=A0ACC1CXW0_9NEOP|nr:hypothetical protein K1T71_007662 [Dendrolimus kikuchii]
MTNVLIIFIQIVFYTKKLSFGYDMNYMQSPYIQHPIQAYYNSPQNVQYQDQIQTHIRSGREQNKYYDSQLDECICSCNKCNNPPVCCTQMCNTCLGQPDNKPNQSNVLVVPFPMYILFVVENSSIATSSPKITTVTTSLSTAEQSTPITPGIEIETEFFYTEAENNKPDVEKATEIGEKNSKIPNEKEITEVEGINTILPQESDSNDKTATDKTLTTALTEISITQTTQPYVVTEEYNRIPLQKQKPCNVPDKSRWRDLLSMRRSKPILIPNYGIIPIPDYLATKLFSQLQRKGGLRNDDWGKKPQYY